MKSYIDYCSDFKINQIKAFIVNLSAVIDENDDVKIFNLQANFKFNFLLMSIAYSAPAEDVDHLFKHFNNDTDGNDDSNVEMYQQILRYNIVILTFVFRIDFVKRNLSKANQNDFN